MTDVEVKVECHVPPPPFFVIIGGQINHLITATLAQEESN